MGGGQRKGALSGECRSVLQCVAVCCSVLQCVAAWCRQKESLMYRRGVKKGGTVRRNALQHTATHCNTEEGSTLSCNVL